MTHACKQPNNGETPGAAAILSALHKQSDRTGPGHGPVTFRLPPIGQKDIHFGLCRTWWNQRILPSASNGYSPEIKSIVDRKPGKVRGVRLILYESALGYFLRIAEQQTSGDPESTNRAAA
jgi:hypothetical protein